MSLRWGPATFIQAAVSLIRSSSVSDADSPVVPPINAPLTLFFTKCSAILGTASRFTLQSGLKGVKGAVISHERRVGVMIEGGVGESPAAARMMLFEVPHGQT